MKAKRSRAQAQRTSKRMKIVSDIVTSIVSMSVVTCVHNILVIVMVTITQVDMKHEEEVEEEKEMENENREIGGREGQGRRGEQRGGGGGSGVLVRKRRTERRRTVRRKRWWITWYIRFLYFCTNGSMVFSNPYPYPLGT